MASTCKKCGEPIVWKKTPKGYWIPCDEGLTEYKADEHGKDLVVNDKGEVIRCELTFKGKADGLARKPHWASCPFADEFRRKR